MNISQEITALETQILKMQEQISKLRNCFTLKDYNIKNDPFKIERIEAIVCHYYGINPEQLSMKTRKREVCQTRQLMFYLIREASSYSLAKIGAIYGDMNHASVLHSINKVKGWLEIDKQYQKEFNEIQEMINADDSENYPNLN